MIKRYFNLIKNFSNWSEYFHYKKNDSISLKLITRKKNIAVHTSKALMGIFKEIFLNDFYHISLIKKVSPPSPIVVDIGANVGYFTLLINEFFTPEKVLCFEPIPNNFKLLKRHFEFDILGKNKLFRLAVSKTGMNRVEMFVNPLEKFSVTASIYENLSRSKGRIVCEATDIEKIIMENELKKIDILKIDVEGSEYDILYSLQKKYFAKINIITMEVHQIDSTNKNLSSLAKFLTENNYKIKTKYINNETSMLWAWIDF